MSIQHVAGQDTGWRQPLADTTGATGKSGSGSSSMVSELSEEFSALAEMFKGMLSGVENDIETQGSSGQTAVAGNSAGSTVEQLLGSHRVALEPNPTPITGGAVSSDGNDPDGLRASSAVDAVATSAGTSGISGSSGAQNSSIDGYDPSTGAANLTCCTLAQAQSVLDAFPGATLEVWPDGSLPVPAGSVSASPDALLPYVINFGTNASTGQTDLYYASVIYNAGQQAMQPTDQGSMKAGEYYVWNTTPDADGVMTTIDAGSSFNQFAQYYMSQINAHKAVDLYSAEA